MKVSELIEIINNDWSQDDIIVVYNINGEEIEPNMCRSFGGVTRFILDTKQLAYAQRAT